MNKTASKTATIAIRHWQDQFEPKGIAVVFDIFRCSTTIHCLHSKQVNDLWVAPSLPAVSTEDSEFLQSLRVFSELKSEIECLERYDNSPHLALERSRAGAPALVATTTGTPAMFAARDFSKVYVGSLCSFSALIQTLRNQDEAITLIPAAFKDSGHIEDEIAAQAVATALDGFADIPDFVLGCAERARETILASGRPSQLAQKLIRTGKEDIHVALDIDRFSFCLELEFHKHYLAKVKACNIG